uniref:ARAD1D46244p n=1 Tax=Blastobotrys adeninivorans TaxID=409370 RepID=A0A060TJE6_BLAAD
MAVEDQIDTKPPVQETEVQATSSVSANSYEDPALDPKNQHVHGHPHHGASAHKEPEVHANPHIGARRDSVHNHDYGAYEDPKTSQDEDLEKGHGPSPDAQESVSKKWSLSAFARTHRWAIHIFIGLLFTAWWISIVAQDKTRHDWLIPTLLWLFIMIRLITFYVPTRPLLMMAGWIWDRTIVMGVQFIPEKLRIPAAGLGTIAVVLIGTFVTPSYEGSPRSDRAISFFGCLVAIFGLWATSNNRKKIVWHTVISGMLIQFIIALFVLRTKCGYDIFNFISFLARKLLGFAKDGVAFLTTDDIAANTFFFFSVLPAIIFFIAFVHLWYYWGILQWFIVKFAYFFFWAMRTSGAEAVVAAASPFIGQGESAILIKPFIPHLTKAEIHQVMTSGFATISGSVLVSYIGMGVNPQALISSCVMSIPASLATSKLRYPETEETLTSGRVVIPEDEVQEADNVLHAFSNGAWLGLIVAGCIMTNLLCIIALVALINALLTWFGHFWGIPNLTLEQIFGYIFYPVAFLLGTPRDELYLVAKLIGVKVIQNEFVGYSMLQQAPYTDMSARGKMLCTYALCGFANLGSVATQIGVLGQLAPSRRGEVSRLALSSLMTGCISTLLSAAVAGMVLADMSRFD